MSKVQRIDRFKPAQPCVECARNARETERAMCSQCVAEYIAAIRRRREAESRLPILSMAVGE